MSGAVVEKVDRRIARGMYGVPLLLCFVCGLCRRKNDDLAGSWEMRC